MAARNAAEGTIHEQAAIAASSKGLLSAYNAWVDKRKTVLANLKRGSKLWWKRAREIMLLRQPMCSIPALKEESGSPVRSAEGKANLFAAKFQDKFVTPVLVENAYTELQCVVRKQHDLVLPDEQACERVLASLDDDSATGPDKIPARVLKKCSKVLAEPVRLLVERMLATGTWPGAWVLHWLVPLHKKKSPSDPKNYRAIHLTSQLGKVLERVFALCFTPYVLEQRLFGPRQFAYQPNKGARDVLAYLVASWLTAFGNQQKVVLYCADVAGAFDRVDTERLAAKLRAKGLHPQLVALFVSWLRERKGIVIVGGIESEPISLANMVFQGTVLGPHLWNLFYEDVRRACACAGFDEIVFANDLNSYCLRPNNTPNQQLMQEAAKCQHQVHEWGKANGVQFEPAKESFHVLSRADPAGESFKLLGVTFDTKLLMADEVHSLVTECSWKLTSIWRTRRLFCDYDLVNLYKAYVLSFAEYRTAAIYHCSTTTLAPLDAIQSRLLKQAGFTNWRR